MAGELNVAIAVLGALAVGGAVYAIASPKTTTTTPAPAQQTTTPPPLTAVQKYALIVWVSGQQAPAVGSMSPAVATASVERVLQSATVAQVAYNTGPPAIASTLTKAQIEAWLQLIAQASKQPAGGLSLATATANVQQMLTSALGTGKRRPTTPELVTLGRAADILGV
jgi:hypothetical protein